MTRKDYRLIAESIKRVDSTTIYYSRETIKGIVDAICIKIGTANPKFDSERFRSSCGFGSESRRT